MKEDYLWDRTGEPDPEVQQLEEILGTLRYQPRPLEIPVDLQVGRHRRFFRDFGLRLAIAATIAMLLLGLGVWLGLQRLRGPQPSEIVQTPKSPGVNSPSPPEIRAPNSPAPKLATAEPRLDRKSIELPRRQRNRTTVARSNRFRRQPATDNQLAPNERNGELAKDQLMRALRVAGTKLSFAQKKMQTPNPRDLIHNQHKIG